MMADSYEESNNIFKCMCLRLLFVFKVETKAIVVAFLILFLFLFYPTDERDAIQKKTFTNWVNKHLIKV